MQCMETQRRNRFVCRYGNIGYEYYISVLGLLLTLPASVDVHSALQAVNLQKLANNPIEVTPEIKKELETYLNTQK